MTEEPVSSSGGLGDDLGFLYLIKACTPHLAADFLLVNRWASIHFLLIFIIINTQRFTNKNKKNND